MYKYMKRIFFSVKVGLMFEDKRLEFQVMRELLMRGIPHEITNHTIGYDAILTDGFVEGTIHVSDPKTAARRVVPYLYGKSEFARVVVGIDPGPRPGVAVVGDGRVVETIQLSSVRETDECVKKIRRGYPSQSFTVRVGNGDVVNRNMIVNSLLPYFTVEIVNEHNTSDAIKMRNTEAAKHIAFARGTVVREELNTVVKEGYLREIQRKSRIESGGKITISRELARDVALGKLSMKQAITIMRGPE